ncbi:MAG: hypothetical protein ABSG82_01130 [Sedimentisphaerales bacterium]|jgi:hypothetical protein
MENAVHHERIKMKKGKEILNSQLPTSAAETRVEILTGIILFAFGAYQSILYFGHTVVPNSDFTSLFRVGRELLSFQMPTSFKQAPVLGLLQNFLYPLAWGSCRELTAGWLLNAILYPFIVLLLWLVGRKIIGRSAVWFALIVAINPWIVYSLTQPIIETTYLFFIILTTYLIFRRSRWAYLAASITTMVRYEGAALILAAFVADIIHRKDRRDVIRAIGYSVLASVPLVIWMVLTVVMWEKGATHYLSVLFGKEYAKGFAEPVENRTGFGLNLQVLWQTGFQPLLIPYPGSSADFAEFLLKLGKTAGVVGFILGCLFAIFKRRWEVLMLLLFFVPYFVLHAYYPYPLARFHSTIFWIALLIAWFGLQSGGGLLARKVPIPAMVSVLLQAAVAIAAIAWLISFIPYFSKVASVSPASASVPYVAMLAAGVIIVSRILAGRFRYVPRHLCVASVVCLAIASNQFMLAPVLGDGKSEIEFKQLGEWFAANAQPNEKLAVYQNDTQLFAGKNAPNVVGFPKAANPRELAAKLRQEGVTYVVWATREGMSKQHTGYQLIGLDKNIAFLDKPRSIGCYEFVGQLGSERGFVNIFRLKDKGEELLPDAGN